MADKHVYMYYYLCKFEGLLYHIKKAEICDFTLKRIAMQCPCERIEVSYNKNPKQV